MAEGYLSPQYASVRGKSQDALIYCKTNIGGYFFDGYLSTKVESELEITSHPVETGASIVDHAYVKPKTITMEIIMSDVHQSLVSGQFDGSWSRSVKAYNVLRQIQEDRIPVSVLVRTGIFENMLIKSITVSDDYKSINGLIATVELVEVPIATLTYVKLSKDPQVTEIYDYGTQAVVETDSSLNPLSQSSGDPLMKYIYYAR